jgi:hypothetical protein
MNPKRFFVNVGAADSSRSSLFRAQHFQLLQAQVNANSNKEVLEIMYTTILIIYKAA